MKKSFKFSLLLFLISIISISQTKDSRQKFRIGFNGSKIDHRQILLTIDERTCDKFDWGFDGEIYQLFEDDFYWMIEGKKYVIQATNSISIDKEIPIGISSSGGEISIKVDALENEDESLRVYLLDKETSKTYDIQKSLFKIELPKGIYDNRFVITFKSVNSINSTSKFIAQDLQIQYDTYSSVIKVSSNEKTIEMSMVNLYTSIGQLVKSWPSTQNFEYAFEAKPGVYIVQTITNKGNLTKKIIIN